MARKEHDHFLMSAEHIGTDKGIMLNGGEGSNLPPVFYEQADSVMNEMFVYATYVDFNFPSPTHLDFQDHTPLDWLNVPQWQDQFHRRGVRMNGYSSYSAHDPNRASHVLFAFCMAKLWDALYYTGTDMDLNGWLRDIRLGEPVTDRPGSRGTVFYREYEHGLVAVNPYGIAQQATVPWTNKPSKIITHRTKGAAQGSINSDEAGTMTIKLVPDAAVLVVPDE